LFDIIDIDAAVQEKTYVGPLQVETPVAIRNIKATNFLAGSDVKTSVVDEVLS
jgi:hypothetical protein